MALQPLPLADGIRVQRLGFGTWAWGNKLLWGYDTDDDPQLQALLGPDKAKALYEVCRSTHFRIKPLCRTCTCTQKHAHKNMHTNMFLTAGI